MLLPEQVQRLLELALAEFAPEWQVASGCTELSLNNPDHWVSGLGTFGLVLNAPLAGLPWGIVGLVAGFVASWCRSIWVAVAALFGGVCGGIYAVAINPFDGWLAPSMLLNGIFGSFLGLLVGVVSSFARAAWRT